ncbi:hypothetical protein F9B52_11260 [Staphylococcus epidermidis]|jgi:hypothetical protein|nr:hypothetical protein [Staphylococcus epidermidis]EHR85381.1 hypothetical protein SEVCU118_2485 [Staphylococcus epidermidis VCU118]EHR98759.1 hypothetical protein SEVCU128_0967 [Staphylococcus epidermidis VCU128]MBS6091940.1 hypothetical protein [Staphylococcus warneri]MDU2401682.1 hypothetical protein [Klebsiella sp.]MDU4095568.1 hypothetical protein [Pantoea sp.]HCV0545858.1 hypothetical protein [Staphylococcus aureus]
MIMNVANYYFKDVDVVDVFDSEVLSESNKTALIIEHKNVVYINKEIKDVSIFDIRNAANKYKKAN